MSHLKMVIDELTALEGGIVKVDNETGQRGGEMHELLFMRHLCQKAPGLASLCRLVAVLDRASSNSKLADASGAHVG